MVDPRLSRSLAGLMRQLFRVRPTRDIAKSPPKALHRFAPGCRLMPMCSMAARQDHRQSVGVATAWPIESRPLW
jgi:hypothetical protein